MKTKMGPLFFLWIGTSLCLVSWASADSEDAREEMEVQQLITLLGDDLYEQRQRAEMHLLERGAEAFAQLKAAENHADIEISTRARYILHQISITWVRPSDPPVVRSIMAHYGELSQGARLAKIAKLSRLEHEQGFVALCRIARFDPMAKIGREAALAILEHGYLPSERTASAVARLRKELGDGDQVPLSWIDVYAAQLESREKMDSRWLTLIDAEIHLLLEDQGETNERRVLKLLRCHLGLSDELADAQAIAASLQRRIARYALREEETVLNWGTALTWKIDYYQWQQLEQMNNRDLLGLVDALTWLIERKQWKALGLLEDRYADAFAGQPWLIYLVAIARGQQGRLPESEQLAASALKLDWGDAEDRNQRTDLIAEFGRHDWAQREWKTLIETLPATDEQSLSARQSLANFCLHDRGENLAAADLLAETLDAIREDPATRKQYQSNLKLLRAFRALQSYHQYFLACHQESQGDHEKQRQHLEQAYKLDPEEIKNVDYLIAMYRMPGSQEPYRKVVQRRIAKARGQIDRRLKPALVNLQRTRQASSLVGRLASGLTAQSLNHWAWLIGNTEGDYAKAVQYSEESLKLQPGNPSYLDTLGRCYYAVGDLEKAVQVEREAVAKHPHMQVMQRQLKLFEEALRSRK